MNKTKLIDLISGKNVFKYYELYKKTQWFSKEEMEEFQLKKLQALVNHCFVNVPYYTEIMKNNSIIPSDIKSIKDLEKFPILTKEIIQENYEKFYPLNLNKIKGVKTSQTSGTTGSVLYKRNDANTRSSVWGSYKRFYDWMGINEKDKNFLYMSESLLKVGKKKKISKYISHKLKNTISISPHDTSKATFDKIISILNNKNIQFIRCYPQALYTLALKLKEHGHRFSLKAIMTTAEPLTIQHRELFKEVFNADCFDQYGSGEIGGLAYECSEHCGLHITEERVIIESNEKNELLITDLDNYSMPFIRYWNADQAIISEKKCACGREGKMIERVLGRTCDCLVGVNDIVVHWGFFWQLLMYDTKIATKRNFKKFQLIQKTKDHLVFRIVGEFLSKEEESQIISITRKKLGDMKIDFIYEEDIENSISGKYRTFINETILR